jgi:ribosomal protein S28E/S33
MRAEIVDYIAANPVPGYTLTQELPWDSNGTPLYLKNFKRIYVDNAQVQQEPLIDVLNGTGIVDEITTVTVRVTTDAKTQPSNYNTMVSTLKNARLDSDITGVTQRATQVQTEMVGDAVVTQFDFSFRQLIVN